MLELPRGRPSRRAINCASSGCDVPVRMSVKLYGQRVRWFDGGYLAGQRLARSRCSPRRIERRRMGARLRRP